jgi:DNA polymerase-1
MSLVAEGTERDKHSKLHTIIREDGSKRFIYAYIYGCWDEMAGQIIFDCLVKANRDGGPEGEALFNEFFPVINSHGDRRPLKTVGGKVRANFLTRIDGFGTLKDRIDNQVDRFGWVYGLDERKIPTRSKHSALNFLIQSCGAILCKRWVCDVYDELTAKYRWGYDGDFVMALWCHDEIQIICRDGLETDIGEIVVKHARASGIPYGFRGPLDSQAKVGQSWKDTH